MEPERIEQLRTEDRRARRRALEVFDRPLVLEAGAGTGKTTALVTRILAWCFGPGWQRASAALAETGGTPGLEDVAARVLQRVVAITFTEAAAAKMGEAVAEALLDVERDALPDWLPADVLSAEPAQRRLCARALRGALDHLGTQTIHAWCRRLLVTHPLEAGLHPRLEIDAEQRLQQEIVREVLEQQLAAAYAQPGTSDALALAGRGGGPGELERQLLALLEEGVAAADLADDPLAPERVEALHARALERFRVFEEAAEGRLHRVRRSPTTSDTSECLDAVRDRLAASAWSDSASLDDFLGWLEERWEVRLRKRLADWGRGKFGKSEQAELGDRQPELQRAAKSLARLLDHLSAIEVEKLALARRVLRGLLVEVEERMRARGVATFSALLTGARALLQRRPEVAARVREGIDQLLVDEFQDTDRRQCDILRTIALSGPAGSRPGLFLVGDPKQSIYGWRSADLRAYHGFLRDVEAAGGELARLSVNYRSAPAILDEVAQVIAPVMQEEEGLQPAFQPLVPSPAHQSDAGFVRAAFAPTEYWVSAGWDGESAEPAPTRASDATRIEARALARDLLALREEGVAWREIGVLFRGRADFETYLAELRAAHVPYAVEGDRSYYQRREVIEAAALVRCVFDPNDQLALVTVLRSSVVGLPDAALLPLWARSFPQQVALLGAGSGLGGGQREALDRLGHALCDAADRLPDDVPGIGRVRGWEKNAFAFCEALAELRRCAREDPADAFVERLRTLTLFETGEAARYLGAWRAANLDRFFRELAQQLVEDASHHSVLRQIRRRVAEEEQREEGVPRDLAEDAVQILTIHGAKGLDFAHVYLMQLHKGRPPARDPDRIEPGAGPAGALEYRLLGTPTLGWDEVSHERDRVEEAERVRTLYVAMTRAESRLVLAGLWPEFQTRKSDGAGQIIGAVARGREPQPDLAQWMAELAAGGLDRRDGHGTRWVFPTLVAEDRRQKVRPRSDEGLPTSQVCAAQAEALRRARERAREREARAFGGTASGLAHEELSDGGAERRFAEPAARRARGGRADAVARAVGTAIHRVLEGIDLHAPGDQELARARASLETIVRGEAPASLRDEALAEARTLLDALAGGELLARLRSLADAVVYRELPVLLPPEPESGPAGFVAGVADLVYRDAAGRLVVADYKTDRLTDLDAPEARERTQAYRRQGAVYQRALREGLELDYEPRFELWYLRADQVRN